MTLVVVLHTLHILTEEPLRCVFTLGITLELGARQFTETGMAQVHAWVAIHQVDEPVPGIASPRQSTARAGVLVEE